MRVVAMAGSAHGERRSRHGDAAASAVATVPAPRRRGPSTQRGSFAARAAGAWEMVFLSLRSGFGCCSQAKSTRSQSEQTRPRPGILSFNLTQTLRMRQDSGGAAERLTCSAAAPQSNNTMRLSGARNHREQTDCPPRKEHRSRLLIHRCRRPPHGEPRPASEPAAEPKIVRAWRSDSSSKRSPRPPARPWYLAPLAPIARGGLPPGARAAAAEPAAGSLGLSARPPLRVWRVPTERHRARLGTRGASRVYLAGPPRPFPRWRAGPPPRRARILKEKLDDKIRRRVRLPRPAVQAAQERRRRRASTRGTSLEAIFEGGYDCKHTRRARLFGCTTSFAVPGHVHQGRHRRVVRCLARQMRVWSRGRDRSQFPAFARTKKRTRRPETRRGRRPGRALRRHVTNYRYAFFDFQNHFVIVPVRRHQDRSRATGSRSTATRARRTGRRGRLQYSTAPSRSRLGSDRSRSKSSSPTPTRRAAGSTSSARGRGRSPGSPAGSASGLSGSGRQAA